MKVKELIELLEKIKDKNKEVGIARGSKFKPLDVEIGVQEYQDVVLLQEEIYIPREYYY